MSVFPYSLVQNMFSPATQMVFNGTDSKFNLANWNVFGGGFNTLGCGLNTLGYGYGYGGNTSSLAGSIFGLVALRAGIGVAGAIADHVKTNRAEKKAAKAQEAAKPKELKKEIDNYTTQINGKLEELTKIAGIDISESNYKNATASNKEVEEAEGKISEAEANKTKNDTEINNYTNQIATLEGEITTLEAKKDAETDPVKKGELATQISLKKQELVSIKNKKAALVKANEEIEKNINKGGELYEALETAKKNKKTTEEKIARLIKDISDLLTKRNEAKAELDAIKNEQAQAEELEEYKAQVKEEEAKRKAAIKAHIAEKREYEKADGTMISRLFGDSIEDENGNLSLPVADEDGNLDINNGTIQRILCKYKNGTPEERTAVKNWLEKNKTKLPVKYQSIVQNIIDGADYYTKDINHKSNSAFAKSLANNPNATKTTIKVGQKAEPINGYYAVNPETGEMVYADANGRLFAEAAFKGWERFAIDGTL